MTNFRRLHRSARLVRVILVSAVAIGFVANRLLPVAAQSEGVTYQNPLAYIGADGQYYVTSLDGTSATAVTPQGTIVFSDLFSSRPDQYGSRPLWSPQGSQFAYTDVNLNLYKVDSGGKSGAHVIDTPTAIGVSRFSWSPDGSQFAYLSSHDFYAIEVIQADGTHVSEVRFSSPNGGGGEDGVGPGPERAWVTVGEERDEDSILHTGFRFHWLNQGFLLGPLSWRGTSLISDKGLMLWNTDDIENISVSPDGSHGVGIKQEFDETPQGETIYPDMIDLMTGTHLRLPLADSSEPLAWTNDGKSIIFGTTSLYKKLNPVDKENATLFEEQEHDDYILTLWRQGLDEKRPTKLFQHEGYDFGTVTVSPDDSAVVFSLISNTVFDKVDPEVQIVAVPMNGGPADWIAIGGKPAFGSNPFTAIPAKTPLNVLPEVNCPKSLISRLKIGQRGQVTPGEPNSLRTLPAGGTQLRDLFAGDKFLVLQGPTCGADGLSWWKVNYRGVIGWTAESDSKEYWLEP